MPFLHIFWEEHEGSWPQVGDVNRWDDHELNELKGQLNRVGLSQVASAIGSLQFDKIDGAIRASKIKM